MLILDVEEQEFWDSKQEIFFETKPIRVRLEHSLISIAKWEANWEKPYLPTPGKAEGISGKKEEIDYIRCMIIGGNVPEYIPSLLLNKYGEEIKEYIGKKHSATTIYRIGSTPPARQVITSELIYYWMIKFSIPFDCQMWHFNRLLMLIDICSVKESEDSKNALTPAEAAKYKQDLNKARRGI